MVEPVKVRRRRGKRIRRRLWRGFVFVLIAALVAALVVTRTDITKNLILPRLGDALGIEIEADSVWVSSDLRLVLSDVVFRVEGVPGRAAEIASVDRALIDPDWRAIFGNRPGATRVQLNGPELLISRSMAGGTYNVASLLQLESAGDQRRDVLPTVLVRDARVRLGVHDDATGEVEDEPTIEVTGGGALTVADADPTSPRYLLRFNGSGDAGNFSLTGRLDKTGLVVDFDRAVLPSIQPELLPPEIAGGLAALDLDGRVEVTRLSLVGRRPSIDLRLDGVGVNVPTGEGEQAEPLRLTDTTGSITAGATGLRGRVVGSAESIRYQAAFDVWGLSPDSPFLSRLATDPFRLERDLRLLRFAPDVVIENIERFRNPEGDMRAEVWLARGAKPESRRRVATGRHAVRAELLERAAGSPGDVEVLAEFTFTNGKAAYQGFPYPFEALRGTLRFDGTTFEIAGITGFSPSGARLEASGEIGPIGPTAEVTLNVDVLGVPIDPTLREAMDENEREALNLLFSRDRYDELLAEQRLLPPAEAAELAAAIAEKESELDAWVFGAGAAEAERADVLAELEDLRRQRGRLPVFSFGGEADAELRLHRLPLEESIWEQTLEMRMDRAGLIPDALPLPIVGEDLKLTVNDGVARLSGGRFRTLSGGDITLTAKTSIEDDGEKESIPEVFVEGTDVPIDPLLIRAIPGPQAADDDGREDRVTGMLREIDLSGLLNARAQIGPDEQGRLDYEIQIDITEAAARIPGPGGVRLDGVGGVIVVEPREIVLSLESDVVAPVQRGQTQTRTSAGLYATVGTRRESPTELAAEFTGVYADAVLDDLDVRVPVEDVLALFDTGLADNIRQIREGARPRGTLTLRAGAATMASATDGDAGSRQNITMTLRDARDLSLRLGTDTITLARSEGHVAFKARPDPRLEFNGFRGPLDVNGMQAGDLSLGGQLSLADRPPRSPAWLPYGIELPVINARLERGRFESPLTRSIIADRLGDDAALRYDELSPEGRFDLALAITRRPGERAEEPAPDDSEVPLAQDAFDALDVRVALEPKALRFDLPRGSISLDRMGGALRGDENGGVIHDLTAEIDDGRVRLFADGSWRSDEGGGIMLDAGWGLDASGVPRALWPALPPPMTDALDGIDLEAERGLSVNRGRLRFTRRSGDRPPTFAASGDLAIRGGALDLAVPVANVEAAAAFEIGGEGPDTSLNMDIRASRAEAAGVSIEDLDGAIERLPEADAPLLVRMTGRAHGGLIALTGRVEPVDEAQTDGAARTGEAMYAIGVRATDVALDGLIADLRDDTVEREPQKQGRGSSRVDASLTLEGPAGSLEGVRGRGRIDASGGRVVEIPLLLPLIEVSNLQLPVGASLDSADANFFIRDRTLTMDSIRLESGALSLLGYGEVALPEGRLDLRFRSSAKRRIPLLSGMVERIRDELVTTVVRGPLDDPDISTETLTGTRRFLEELTGGESDSRLRTLRRLESEALGGVSEAPARGTMETPTFSPESASRTAPPTDRGEAQASARESGEPASR